VNLGEGGLVENDYFTANCSMPRSFAACANFRAGWWHGRPARVFLVRHSPNFRGHTRARPVPLRRWVLSWFQNHHCIAPVSRVLLRT